MSVLARPTEHFESHLDVIEAFFAAPWSDGLPIVPPTPDLVERMVEAGGLDGQTVIGTLKERSLTLHVWQAATCAVMAGCLPQYFPVILATWNALLEPKFNLNTILSSTGGAALAAVVSGPYAEEIGMRSGAGLFGPGNRPNNTIGRAIRLGALTAFKAIPGQLDASCYGHGGKFGFHFAEGPRPEGWPTIREQLGYDLDATTVSVMAAEAPRQVMHRWSPSAGDLLKLFGSAMRPPSANSTGATTPFMIVIGPEHALVMAESGLKPGDIRAALSDISAVTIEDLASAGIKHDSDGVLYAGRDAKGRYITAKADNILIVTAGGQGAGWSNVIASFTSMEYSSPVTRPVLVPGRISAPRDASRAELDFV
jgi:hypothetical protein